MNSKYPRLLLKFCSYVNYFVYVTLYIFIMTMYTQLHPFVPLMNMTYPRVHVLAILQIISAEQRSSKHWELTTEGQETAEKGSHEARVFNAIPEEGLAQAELMVSQGQRHQLSLACCY